MNYIYSYVCVEMSQDFWNKAKFIIMNHSFDVFLNYVCKYFSENLRIYVYQRELVYTFLL